MRHRLLIILTALVVAVPSFQFFGAGIVHAAANISVGGSSNSVKIGDTLNIVITVNTGGVSANAFQGNFSYPSNLFEGVRGTFSGSICTLPISQPDPADGGASFSCGRPSGFSGTGTVATIVLKAIASGSGSFGMSGCQVLANDGQGTDISGGCSGAGVTVLSSEPTPPPATPTPTPVATATPKPTATPKTSPTPKPSTSPKPTASPTPTQVPVAAEQPKTPPPTDEPTPPPVQSLAPSTPTPEGAESTEEPSDQSSQPRTIAQAIQDILSSSKDLKNLHSSPAGVIALMVTTIPFLGLILAIFFLAYRLYIMERRRRRTLDRLFEMELSELAALEGKLDLLAEKGAKGREQYRDEFKKAKENILRQLKPGFGKAIDPEPGEKK